MRFASRGISCPVSFNPCVRRCGLIWTGLYEFVKKGDAPVMGVTKLANGVTEQDLKRPRVKLPLEQQAARMPAAADQPAAPL